jgi:dCMP deaminase
MFEPESRPSFIQLYLELARGLAWRSTCARLRVGCVIASVDYRYIYGVGYNGNYAGGANTCDRPDPGNCGCLHAEDNAVINCTASRYEPKVVIVTHLPCAQCAKRLVNLGGVQRVVYGEDYRLKDSLQIFDRANVRYMQFAPALDAKEA